MALRLLISILCLYLAGFSSVRAQHPFFKQYISSDGLSSNKIYDLLRGLDGKIWMATNKGVTYYDQGRLSVPSQPAAMREAGILGLYQASSGKIWAWAETGALFSGNATKGFQSFHLPPAMMQAAENRIMNSFLASGKDHLQLGTVIGGGLYQLKKGKLSTLTTKKAGTYSFYVRQFSENQFVWGSNGPLPPNNTLRILLLNNVTYDIQLSDNQGFSKSSFIPLADGTYLFAKNFEIIHFDQQGVIQRGFLPKKVERIYQSDDGKIWVALHSGGVVCYLSDELSLDVSTHYLSTKTITDVQEDPEGNLWFASLEEGLFRLSSKPEIQYKAPKIFVNTGNDPVSRDPADNPTIEPSPLTIQPLSDPLQNFINDTVIRDSAYPVVFISSIKINNEDTTLHDIYHLHHEQNFISLNFAGFLDNQPQKLQYKYRLQGLDTAWVFTNTPNAQYSRLLPGDYVFSVFAMDNNGLWSKTPAKVTFFISPPFWNTWLFYAILIIGFLLFAVLVLIYGLRRSRERAKMNRQALLTELKILRTQMNPHFTFNTLSSIQNYIGSHNNEAAIGYLSKFAKLMRSILENTKKPTIPIRDEMQALTLYMDLERLRLNERFNYDIKIDPEIDIQYDQIPSMLIQPYVENAIWHGFPEKNESGKILVELKRKDNFIICTIEDNGIGREAAKKRNGHRTNHTSMGMSITKERLEIINSLKDSTLSVNITDLKNPAGQAAGTKVEIFIPVEG